MAKTYLGMFDMDTTLDKSRIFWCTALSLALSEGRLGSDPEPCPCLPRYSATMRPSRHQATALTPESVAHPQKVVPAASGVGLSELCPSHVPCHLFRLSLFLLSDLPFHADAAHA